MTLRHLKIFVAICEHGGVTKAAEALHIAQPAVSTTLSELEKYYNVILFDRINQRLVITEMGKRLLVKAKEVIAGFEDFEELAIEGGSNPKIRIGCSLTLGKTFLPKYINTLKKQIPVIEPTVVINKTSFIEKELENGNLDFGFVEGEIDSPYLNVTRFADDRIVAVCSSDFEVPNSTSLSELINYPLLLREEGSASRDMFDRAISFFGYSAKPMIESASNQCLISSVESGLGVAILPEGLVWEHLRNGTIKEIAVPGANFSRTHYLLIHKNKRLNPIGKQAYDCVLQMQTRDLCCKPSIYDYNDQRIITEVVAALIWRGDKFMICQRPAHKARGLLWEFVGGKVESGETKEQALLRECREELAVTLSVGDVFMEVVHKYPDLTVHLTLFNAAIAEGEPQKLEHNDIRWIAPSEIPNYEFCPADEEILAKICEVNK